jgi:hypothetical protein
MPSSSLMWRHVIISTRRSWLHGDERGFRSRDHRIHSSGDYKNPPPAGEHAELQDYHLSQAKGPPVKIPRTLRREVGSALLCAVLLSKNRVLVIAVGQKHAHALVRLPRSRKRAKRIVGKWKATRTPALRKALPRRIWGEGGKYKPVKTRDHLRTAFKYIRDEQGPGASVWTYGQGIPEEASKAVRRLLRDRARKRKRRK